MARALYFKVLTVKLQRHLAPTAAPLSFLDILRGVGAALYPKRFRSSLESQLKEYFGVEHVFLVSSGKAALTLILRALQTGSPRREVIIPAYTCFSVASAVRRAGLQVVLCDIDPGTLDFNLVRLKSVIGRDTLAVVAPHLLGQPADIVHIRGAAENAGAFVVEDAAQAMGGRDHGRWLGTQGDVGFFSLGRGKNVSAGSGGVIVTNSPSVADALDDMLEGMPSEPVSRQFVELLAVVATRVLLHPLLYWLPAGLPFLGLGETKYDETFPIYRMSNLGAGLLFSWKSRLDRANRSRFHNSRLFLERLPASVHMHVVSKSRESAPLRLPLLMPSAQAKATMCRMAHEQGLGVSALYPATIAKIPELTSMFQSKEYPGAEAVVSRLVTIPVHQYVTEQDVDRIVKAIDRSWSGTQQVPVDR